MGEIKLRPCPFCGEKATEEDVVKNDIDVLMADGFNVICDCCGSMYGPDRQGAIDDWNRRPIEDALLAACEELMRPHSLMTLEEAKDRARAAIRLAKGESSP